MLDVDDKKQEVMQITLDPIYDPIVIKKALMIDDIYKDVIHEDINTWQPNLALSAYFYVYRDDVPFGIILIERFCSNSLVIHGGVFKMNRNQNTPLVLKEVIRQFKELTKKEIVTFMLPDNLPALKMIKKAGFKEKCIIKNASLKGDIIVLGED